MRLGLTALRAAVGAIFFAHGTQKLFGWFGGPGREGVAQGFDAMGLRPGKRNAVLAGASETTAGTLLATGFLTPVGAAAGIAVMDQAIRTVHLSKGFFNTEGGYEFNMLLGASAFALADIGPGPWSLERAMGLKLHGPAWALAALAAGLAGPRVVERLAPAPEPEPEPTHERFVRDTAAQPTPAGSA
jgi:putative oxidoreductase